MAQDLRSRPLDDTLSDDSAPHDNDAATTVTRAGRRVARLANVWWRVPALAALALLALPLYARVNSVSGTFLSHPTTLLWPLLGLSALYAVACLLIVGARGPRSRRVALVELGVLLLAGVVFRAVVFGTPPLISHDAYRYAWDPYLLAHGVSPYLHTPSDPALIPLRDGAIWPMLNWRNAPTIYPPGAQSFFFLVYLVKPLSIWAVKTAITASDAIVGALLLALLRRRGLDARLTLLYWWSPIAVIEFAGNAHIDAVAVAWVLLALLLAEERWRGARFAAGVALALATLTKFYPLLFVLAIGRRRDRSLYVGLAGTIALAYLPFLGGGSRSTGFLATYVGQRFPDQGILVVAIARFVGFFGGGDALVVALQAIAALALCGVILRWRIRRGPSIEATTLGLTALYFALAPHTFPWYVAIVLPLVALLVGRHSRYSAASTSNRLLPHPTRPFPLRREGELARRRFGSGSPVQSFRMAVNRLGSALAPTSRRYGKGAGGIGSAPVLAMWLFALWIPFTYIMFAPGGNAHLFVWLSLATVVDAALPWLISKRHAVFAEMHADTGASDDPQVHSA
ncbi:MAG TPA: glycosyltransferase 87 family protein [Ktedonobacterales bacterium]|nr:glycosyltransferase 87 family protein [Ktedonobacterales bacterium]